MVTIATVTCPARASDPTITPEARMHFAAGVALLQDPKAPRYEEAYREFKAAYAATPSYKILGNLGLCAMKIERDAEAIWAYETYLKEGGADLTPVERDQIRRDLLTLKAGVVRMTVSSDPPGATIVDVRVPVQGSDITNSYGEATAPLALGLRRGHHILTAHMPGHPDRPWELEAGDGTPSSHTFEMGPALPAATTTPTAPPPAANPILNPPPDSGVVVERPLTVAPFVTGGLSVALALGGAYFGVQALRKHDQYEGLNDGTHVNEASDVRSRGETLNVVTDAMLGAAVVGAGVTAYLVLTRRTVERRIAEARKDPSQLRDSSNANSSRSLRILPDTLHPTWSSRGAGLAASWAF